MLSAYSTEAGNKLGKASELPNHKIAPSAPVFNPYASAEELFVSWLLAAGAFWIGISFGFVGGAWWASANARGREMNEYTEQTKLHDTQPGE